MVYHDIKNENIEVSYVFTQKVQCFPYYSTTIAREASLGWTSFSVQFSEDAGDFSDFGPETLIQFWLFCTYHKEPAQM